MAALSPSDPSGGERPAYMAQFKHGSEPEPAGGGGGPAPQPSDIYSVDVDEASKKSPEELETMVQELDGAFRRDMGALTQKYDRARGILVGLLEPEAAVEEDGEGEDGEDDGGIYG